MLRKLIFVVSAIALTLVACGRQVTPDRTGTSSQGLQPGQMQIKFNTAGPMNFTSTWYVMVLNTSGTGTEPYAINGNPQQNWKDYSFEILVYQLPGQASPQAALFEFLNQQNLGGGTQKTAYGPLTYNPQNLQLNPNCNGQQTQLCVTVDRFLFAGLAQGGATAAPSASPSASPSGSPGPSPTTQPFAGVWFINWFTVSPSTGAGAGGQVIDAPGLGGPNDASWLPPLPPSHNYDTATSFDAPWTAVAGWPQVANSSAQIAGGEVLNNP